MEEITTTLLRQALDSTRDGLTIAEVRDNDHPLIYVNSAFERLTGYSRLEVLGRDCRFLQGPETDRRTVDLLKAALIEGRPACVILLNYRKDGSAFWNELSVAPIRGAALGGFRCHPQPSNLAAESIGRTDPCPWI
ncbi:adenylate cyclase [Methylomarinovum caldicuralii]|uniref:Adenylate cyclase n=1 Tax=Methylomarinovum caldicuralii TaxID=438856 RepID=A0AAU9CHK1_9GAMM|nr:PAS domain-containing protein [Methylomarinovum caldicuralii]BCX82475.1 adenylate cyclase [Methylomarinovum caldicuralii]